MLKKDKNVILELYKIQEPTIDLVTFNFLDQGYAKDKNNIYYYGKILKNATINCYKSPCYKQ